MNPFISEVKYKEGFFASLRMTACGGSCGRMRVEARYLSSKLTVTTVCVSIGSPPSVAGR
jgi:hypothetical protein